MNGWPNDHTIGVYLSDGADLRLVATVRSDKDLPSLFHGLAKRLADSGLAWPPSDGREFADTCGCGESL